MDGTYDSGCRDERVVIDSLWKAIWQMACPTSAHAQEKFQVSIVDTRFVMPDIFYLGSERARKVRGKLADLSKVRC
jgi:hypothetical protein